VGRENSLKNEVNPSSFPEAITEGNSRSRTEWGLGKGFALGGVEQFSAQRINTGGIKTVHNRVRDKSKKDREGRPQETCYLVSKGLYHGHKGLEVLSLEGMGEEGEDVNGGA